MENKNLTDILDKDFFEKEIDSTIDTLFTPVKEIEIDPVTGNVVDFAPGIEKIQNNFSETILATEPEETTAESFFESNIKHDHAYDLFNEYFQALLSLEWDVTERNINDSLRSLEDISTNHIFSEEGKEIIELSQEILDSISKDPKNVSATAPKSLQIGLEGLRLLYGEKEETETTQQYIKSIIHEMNASISAGSQLEEMPIPPGVEETSTTSDALSSEETPLCHETKITFELVEARPVEEHLRPLEMEQQTTSEETATPEETIAPFEMEQPYLSEEAPPLQMEPIAEPEEIILEKEDTRLEPHKIEPEEMVEAEEEFSEKQEMPKEEEKSQEVPHPDFERALKDSVAIHIDRLNEWIDRLLPVEDLLSKNPKVDKLYQFHKRLRLDLKYERDRLLQDMESISFSPLTPPTPETQEKMTSEHENDIPCPSKELLIAQWGNRKIALLPQEVAFEGKVAWWAKRKSIPWDFFHLNLLKDWPWSKLQQKLMGEISQLDEKSLKNLKLKIIHPPELKAERIRYVKNPHALILYAMGKGVVMLLDSPTQPFSLSEDWQWMPSRQSSEPWPGSLNKGNINLPVAAIETLFKE